MNSRMTPDSYLHLTIQMAHMKLSQMKQFLKYMTIESRQKVLKANILSIFQYGMAQYIGENDWIKKKFHTSVMKICRTVRGFKKNRESNEEVLKDLNLETP